jgi:hypothetical protein
MGIVKRARGMLRKSMEAERRKAAVKLSGQRILENALKVKPHTNVAIAERAFFTSKQAFFRCSEAASDGSAANNFGMSVVIDIVSGFLGNTQMLGAFVAICVETYEKMVRKIS